MLKSVITLLCLLLPLSLAAQSSDLQSSVQSWLSGEGGLNRLAALARSGDTDAQLLLGQIDRDTIPGGYSPETFSLSLQDRNNLLRSTRMSPSKNWLLDLSDQSMADFGQALFAYRTSRDVVGSAVEMQRLNERAAAQYLLWLTFDIGKFDQVNTMPTQNYGLSDVDFMNWLRTYLASPNKALTINRFVADQTEGKVMGLLSIDRLAGVLNLRPYFSVELEQLISILRGRGDSLPDNANLVALNLSLQQLAQSDPTLGIVIKTCAKCTDAQPDYDCIIQSLEMVGGYSSLLAIRTPVERVIPADTFLASNRPVVTFTNLIRSYSNYYQQPLRSSCIASIISD